MKFLTFLVIVLLSNLSFGQNHIFYGVEGWANQTLGGSGGKIIRVTNLNSSGPGSFREAVTKTSPRIIVFEVGGTINLQGSSIQIKSPFVTIAGQTAPAPGIMFKNGGISISTHDVIIQHISIRPGAAGKSVGWEPDALSTNGASFTIIDHCSTSWAVDENCSASGPRFEGDNLKDWQTNTSHNVTISNCIIAEGLSNATHTKVEHSKGTLIHDNATNVLIQKNLYAHNKSRNPLFKGGAQGVICNNFIYNPGSDAIMYALNSSEWIGHEPVYGKMSIVGNYLQYGVNTSNIPLMKMHSGPCYVYLLNNEAYNLNGNSIVQYSGDSKYLQDQSPIWNNNIQLIETNSLEAFVLKNAGATPWLRNSIDSRITNDVRNRTGRIIDFETEVGGFPEVAPTSQAFTPQNWDMTYLIQKSAHLKPKLQNSKPFYQDSTIHLLLDTTGINLQIEKIDMISNGYILQSKNTDYSTWKLTSDTIGNCKLQFVAHLKNSNLRISNPIYINIVSPASNTEQSKLQVKFQYNQSEQSLHIYTPDNTLANIQIMDAKGVVIQKFITKESINNFVVSNLQPGLYFANISSKPNYSHIYKFIKK